MWQNLRVASATECLHHFCGSTVRGSWSGSTGRSLAQQTECGSRFRFRGQIAPVFNVRRGFLRVLRRTLGSTFASLGVLTRGDLFNADKRARESKKEKSWHNITIHSGLRRCPTSRDHQIIIQYTSTNTCPIVMSTLTTGPRWSSTPQQQGRPSRAEGNIMTMMTMSR